MDLSELTNIISPLTLVVITAGVVGAVQLVKEIINAVQQYKTVGISVIQSPLTIVVAALIGALVAAYMGTDFMYGIIIGLAATGVYKLTKNIG